MIYIYINIYVFVTLNPKRLAYSLVVLLAYWTKLDVI